MCLTEKLDHTAEFAEDRQENDYLKLSLEDWFDTSENLYLTVVCSESCEYSGNPEHQKGNC